MPGFGGCYDHIVTVGAGGGDVVDLAEGGAFGWGYDLDLARLLAANGMGGEFSSVMLRTIALGPHPGAPPLALVHWMA